MDITSLPPWENWFQETDSTSGFHWLWSGWLDWIWIGNWFDELAPLWQWRGNKNRSACFENCFLPTSVVVWGEWLARSISDLEIGSSPSQVLKILKFIVCSWKRHSWPTSRFNTLKIPASCENPCFQLRRSFNQLLNRIVLNSRSFNFHYFVGYLHHWQRRQKVRRILEKEIPKKP